MPVSLPVKRIPALTGLNNLAETATNIEVLVPKELPVYKFQHPYGKITVYGATDGYLTPERIYLLLEQAKHDLLAQHIAAIPVKPTSEE